ncbi:hypothetical protein ACFL27_19500 [candidate division CSSED10-310 bacterium]|uniref:DUF4595 domain-containing protein n=1 Tax=candidate division CSSED10-310 bacterium TaxID=2855610 RepID=A0ABV6Z1V3_UNCC1
MLHRRWLILVVIGLLVLVPCSLMMLSCTSSDDDDDNNDDDSTGTIIPLNVGAILVYKVTVQGQGDYTETLTVNGPTTKNGVNCFKTTSVSTDMPQVNSFTQVSYYVIDNDNIKNYFSEVTIVYPNNITGLIENEWDPYVLMYPSKAALATTSTWHDTGNLYQDIYQNGQQVGELTYTYTSDITYLGREQKTITLGTYDCHKFQRHMVVTTSGVTVDTLATLYVHEDTGLIYGSIVESGITETRELTSVTGP